MKTHICDHCNTCFIKLGREYKCFINQNSYYTFSPFVIIKIYGFEEKKEMTLDIIVNPQWPEVEGLMVVISG